MKKQSLQRAPKVLLQASNQAGWQAGRDRAARQGRRAGRDRAGGDRAGRLAGRDRAGRQGMRAGRQAGRQGKGRQGKGRQGQNRAGRDRAGKAGHAGKAGQAGQAGSWAGRWSGAIGSTGVGRERFFCMPSTCGDNASQALSDIAKEHIQMSICHILICHNRGVWSAEMTGCRSDRKCYEFIALRTQPMRDKWSLLTRGLCTRQDLECHNCICASKRLRGHFQSDGMWAQTKRILDSVLSWGGVRDGLASSRRLWTHEIARR